MKSLKLTISAIFLGIISIGTVFSQDAQSITIDKTYSELSAEEQELYNEATYNKIEAENKQLKSSSTAKENSSNQMANTSNQIKVAHMSADEQAYVLEQNRIAKLYPASDLLNLVNEYESATNYQHEDEIQQLILNGCLDVEWLNTNNIDTNSKLYKKVSEHKKLSK